MYGFGQRLFICKIAYSGVGIEVGVCSLGDTPTRPVTWNSCTPALLYCAGGWGCWDWDWDWGSGVGVGDLCVWVLGVRIGLGAGVFGVGIEVGVGIWVLSDFPQTFFVLTNFFLLFLRNYNFWVDSPFNIISHNTT